MAKISTAKKKKEYGWQYRNVVENGERIGEFEMHFKKEERSGNESEKGKREERWVLARKSLLIWQLWLDIDAITWHIDNYRASVDAQIKKLQTKEVM